MRILAIFISLLVAFPCVGSTEKKSFSIFLWAEAFPEWVFSEFTEETGIKIWPTFFSNEGTLADKFSQFPENYDLIECSNSFVFQNFIEAGLVEKIDPSLYPFLGDLDPQITSKLGEPGNQYMLPYVWGSLLLAVNTGNIKEGTIKGFADLWAPNLKGRIIIPDDLRSVLSFTLISQGFSPNDQDLTHWKASIDKLEQLITSSTVIRTNSLDALIDGEISVAVNWNGAILEAVQRNAALKAIEPQEGTVLWVDGFFISQQAKNKEAAYEFLKFIFRPDICARITEDTLYATSNSQAKKYLPDSIVNNALIYPSPKVMETSELEKNLPHLIEMQQEWIKLRSRTN